MSRIERLILVIILLFISVLAIHLIGAEYYALLAIFDTLIGVLIGMVMFIPNNDGGY